jgi:hypothetical protein
MSNWTRSNVSHEQLLCLVEAGQLPPLTAGVEWRVPDDESVPRLLTVYIRIKLHVDLQADKSFVIVKGSFFPQV